MIIILYIYGYLRSSKGSFSQLLAKYVVDNNIETQVDAPAIPITEPKNVIDFCLNNKTIVRHVPNLVHAFFIISMYRAIPIRYYNLRD